MLHRLSAIVLVDPAGRLLLQERDEHAPADALKWGLVGGHVEDGESFEDAAYRELAEETGAVLGRGDLRRWRDVERDDEDGSQYRLTVWVAATALTDADIELGEGLQIVFVEPDRLTSLPLADIARLVTTDLLASDLYRELLP